ncbi:MAG: pyridoxamine 5'-phosphate oxidase family protein [Actinomycetota bacterium]|nr:pyridoxamine 5'-phosphate oxidase family protein [Actinomycetota bacterium]
MNRPQDEVLDNTECWHLLATETMGRLATATDHGVRIWPVNYRTRGETLLFRSDPGSKVWDIAANAHVSFEIDGSEGDRHWSVVVTGRAEVVDADEPWPHVPHDEIVTQNPGAKRILLRITPATVSGRRFTSAASRSSIWGGRPVAWRTPS